MLAAKTSRTIHLILPCPIRLQEGPNPCLSWALSPADKSSGCRLRASLVKLTKFLLVALTQIATVAHQPTAITPEIVVVQSGALQLKALLWLPDNGGPFPAVLFNHGSGSSDAMHTGPFVITEAAERLGPILAKHGYAFLYLFRRGQGLSADQGDFMQKLLQREKMTNGEEARKRLQFRLLTTDHLDDVIAGLSFLTKLPRSTLTVLRSLGTPSVVS